MIAAGLDAGSRAIKAVVVDSATGAVLGRAVGDQGVDQARRADRVLAEAAAAAGVKVAKIGALTATGYGRDAIERADRTVTEITCQGRGVRAVMPDVRTVIDIGGQDSKLLRLDEAGRVQDFVMNDRCAAGTGRFLEVVAARLGLGLGELGAAAGRSVAPAAISSMCVVFAETEIVSLLAAGGRPADIVAGVRQAIAARVAAMAGRRTVGPVALTGGVALIPGMAEALGEALGLPVAAAPHPQFTGALGAALLAAGD